MALLNQITSRIDQLYDFFVSQMEYCSIVEIKLEDSGSEKIGTSYRLLKDVKFKLEKKFKCELTKKKFFIGDIQVCVGATLIVKKEN